MVIGDGITNRGDVVDVFPYKYPRNIIPSGTGWVNKAERCKIVSDRISGRLDVNRFIYHYMPLKDVTKVDILKRMYSESRN